jgi:hypothetical protein
LRLSISPGCTRSPCSGPACRPAPRAEVRSQGFRAESPFDSRFATYEDRRVDYVTSEPAIDYTASSILLLAALEGRC